MRLKLVLIASAIAAIAGSGASIAIIMFASVRPLSSPGLFVAVTYLLPTATILLASIFVYRHTARRRRLQAVLTATLAILLSLAAFFLASLLTNAPLPRQRPTKPSNVG
jgi:hypothetical protein